MSDAAGIDTELSLQKFTNVPVEARNESEVCELEITTTARSRYNLNLIKYRLFGMQNFLHFRRSNDIPYKVPIKIHAGFRYFITAHRCSQILTLLRWILYEVLKFLTVKVCGLGKREPAVANFIAEKIFCDDPDSLQIR